MTDQRAMDIKGCSLMVPVCSCIRKLKGACSQCSFVYPFANEKFPRSAWPYRSRHLLLFVDRKCSNGEWFLGLFTAVLRIVYPKSLEIRQLCFSSVSIQLHTPKICLYKKLAKYNCVFYILHLSSSFLDIVHWKLLQIPSPFVEEPICWLTFLAQCSHIKHHWLQFPPEPL